MTVSAADFSHATELIERARPASTKWLEEGGPELPRPARFLSLHDHDGALAPSPIAYPAAELAFEPRPGRMPSAALAVADAARWGAPDHHRVSGRTECDQS